MVPDSIPVAEGLFSKTTAEFYTDFGLPESGINTIDIIARGRAAQHFGMWALIDMQWTSRLAEWIGDRTVLEVMAGNGWLSKALTLHGIRCIATDSRREKWPTKPVFPIRKIPAIKAVKQIRADIMIVSWPPYECSEIVEVCKWRGTRPMIYIGEGKGGCNAPDEFWANFSGDKLDVGMPQWACIHDCVLAGNWRGPHY